MTPNDYCYQKIASRGSANYYVLRKLNLSKRNAIAAILAFYQEIEAITLDYQEKGIATAKLNWWREQILKISIEKLEHPIALALQENFEACTFLTEDQLKKNLLEIIDGLEQNLSPCLFQTFQDVVIQVMRTAGNRDLLISQFLDKTHSINSEVIYQFSLFIELVNHIQHLHRYAMRGIIYFSIDEMQHYSVTEKDFFELKDLPPIQNLLSFQNEKIKKCYAITANTLKQPYFIIRSKIALAIWDAICEENYKVLENFITITPLRYWWISWVYS